MLSRVSGGSSPIMTAMTEVLPEPAAPMRTKILLRTFDVLSFSPLSSSSLDSSLAVHVYIVCVCVCGGGEIIYMYIYEIGRENNTIMVKNRKCGICPFHMQVAAQVSV